MRLGSRVAVALLCACNVLVFWPHFAGLVQVPWDFSAGYYAYPAYWTSAVRAGAVPQWVPFEQLGYPFWMNLQTGIAYPPLWVFPLTGLRYTFHAAAVLYALHVLWGGVGAYALARVWFGRGAAALLAGLAFSFFGGFFSNAQHVDIVRAWAWLPWLLWAATLEPERLRGRNLALPAVVALVVAASYPGNLASHLLAVGVYLLAQLGRVRPARVVAALGLVALGVLLCLPALAPAWALRGLLTRSAGEHPVQMGWPWSAWPFLFLPWLPGLPHPADLSMSSVFVPVTCIALLAVLRRPVLVRLAPALLLVPGDASPLSRIVRVVPVLNLSRFPSSDWRGVVGLSLVLLATGALHALLAADLEDVRRTLKRQLWLALLPLPLLAWSRAPGALLRPIAVLLVFAVLAIALLASARVPLRRLGLFALLAVTAVSGYWGVTTAAYTWVGAGVRTDYKAHAGFFPDDDGLPVEERLRNPPVRRPARVDSAMVQFSWRGYLDGSYQTRDQTGTQFRTADSVTGDPALRSWMLQPWELRAVAPGADLCAAVRAGGNADMRARPVRYGTEDVRYDVQLPEPAVVVSNELAFPGWSARIAPVGGGAAVDVRPVTVCGGLRGWALPAGTWRVHEHFAMPGLRASAVVSGALWVLYAAGVLVFLRRGRAERSPVLARDREAHRAAQAREG